MPLCWLDLMRQVFDGHNGVSAAVHLSTFLPKASECLDLMRQVFDGHNGVSAAAIVEYASAVYMTDLTALYTWTCSRCNDLTQGFEIRCIIVDVQNCLQAFIGVDHNLNAIIIVAIRGTQENSIQNWIKDLIWKQDILNYTNMPSAKVHTGFYSSYNNTLLRPAITNAVRKARKLYGDIGTIVTGHSMGGAMASFCALDLDIKQALHAAKITARSYLRSGRVCAKNKDHVAHSK